MNRHHHKNVQMISYTNIFNQLDKSDLRKGVVRIPSTKSLLVVFFFFFFFFFFFVLTRCSDRRSSYGILLFFLGVLLRFCLGEHIDFLTSL